MIAALVIDAKLIFTANIAANALVYVWAAFALDHLPALVAVCAVGGTGTGARSSTSGVTRRAQHFVVVLVGLIESRWTLVAGLAHVALVAAALAVALSRAAALALAVVVAYFVGIAQALLAIWAVMMLGATSLCFFDANVSVEIGLRVLIRFPPAKKEDSMVIYSLGIAHLIWAFFMQIQALQSRVITVFFCFHKEQCYIRNEKLYKT